MCIGDETISKTLLVVHYSKTGTTQKMAEEIARGARDSGADVVSKNVTDCSVAELAVAGGIAFGSPTHYCNIAWQSMRFLDDTILEFYAQGQSLKGKVCGCFTSTGGYEDGIECLRMLELAFGITLKMQVIPGVVLESKEVAQGNLSKCYEFGQRIAQAIATRS